MSTSNVTGRHRGLKQKLRAGYRAPSLKCTSYLCGTLLCVHTLHYSSRSFYSSGVLHKLYFSSLSVLSRAFSVHYACIWRSGIILTPGYSCAKFRFYHTLHCWASLWRKIAYSVTQSLTHPAYLIPLEPKLSLRIKLTANSKFSNISSYKISHLLHSDVHKRTHIYRWSTTQCWVNWQNDTVLNAHKMTTE